MRKIPRGASREEDPVRKIPRGRSREEDLMRKIPRGRTMRGGSREVDPARKIPSRGGVLRNPHVLVCQSAVFGVKPASVGLM